MLNTDLTLAFNISTSSADCPYCGLSNERCGPNGPPLNQPLCTNPVTHAVIGGNPGTLAQVQNYATNNAAFLADFQAVFAQLTTLGYGGVPGTGATVSGKIGSVTGIDLSKC